MSDFDRYSLTIARWLTSVYDTASPAENPTTPGDATLTRLRRMIVGLLTICLAAGAGWLGILLAPHVGKILLTAAAIALLWVLAICVIDFFRSS
ncbi:hypothetical protein [Microbacterium sp. LCT-H2]|uniref:hypothetical protein n=1 Tax=Microbacterium sp. LCT-H2 TaxID=1914306 RepID=UPI00115FF604|nr:hypothetical protein [Microbacterium sp. LCT-H2]